MVEYYIPRHGTVRVRVRVRVRFVLGVGDAGSTRQCEVLSLIDLGPNPRTSPEQDL